MPPVTAATSDRAAMVDELITARAMILAGRVIGQDATAICNAIDRSLALLQHPMAGLPEQRNTHDVLVSLCQLAEEQLAVSRHILSALNRPSAESRSSVEFDSNGSAGKVKVKVKEYVDQPVDETLSALKQKFTSAMADIEDAQSAGWRATVNGLAAEGAVAHG